MCHLSVRSLSLIFFHSSGLSMAASSMTCPSISPMRRPMYAGSRFSHALGWNTSLYVPSAIFVISVGGLPSFQMRLVRLTSRSTSDGFAKKNHDDMNLAVLDVWW